MSLIQTIQNDVIKALKNGDTHRLGVLRFIVSQAKYKQIELQRELTDEDMVAVIRKQVKELAESATQFRAGAREDLAKDNDAQEKILREYLPQEISDTELDGLVRAYIKDNQSQFDANPKVLTGKVVGFLKSKAAPERIVKAYNSIVSAK